MKTFLVERVVPGAGVLDELIVRRMMEASYAAARRLEGRIRVGSSMRTMDRFICILEAQDASDIHEHGLLAGIPVDGVREIVGGVQAYPAAAP